tara:strand:+ start:121 stop:1191 length:1071 start_codon:yes stop_codon:yes gene_type:complete
MYCKKHPILDILKKTNLTERIVRRVINQNLYPNLRERYLLYLVNKAYREGISLNHMSEQSSVPYAVLTRTKRKNGISTVKNSPPNKRLTLDIEKKMIHYYQDGNSSEKTAKKFGYKTSKTVLDVLHKHNIRTRCYSDYFTYNEKAFSNICSHDEAYVLGLLLSDGYVLRDYEGVGIDLHYGDIDLLKSVSGVFGPSCRVTSVSSYRKKDKKYNNRSIMSKDRCRLLCYNKPIANNLKKYGMIKRKTYNLQFPKIANCYYSSFFRGFIDGDGSIGINKSNGYPWCKVYCYHLQFLKDMSEKLNELGYDSKIYSRENMNSLYIGNSRNQIIDFIKYIYRNKGNLFLERKYEKVQNQIN